MYGRVQSLLQRSVSTHIWPTQCKHQHTFHSRRKLLSTALSTSWTASRLRRTFSLMHGRGGMKICSLLLPPTSETRSVYVSMPRHLAQSSSQIHVDRYKDGVYSHLSHAGLSRIITRDMSSTRFHACERFDRCEEVERLGKSVVYVNPAPMGLEDWRRYLDATREKLKYGEKVTSLVRCSTPYAMLSLSSLKLSSVLCGDILRSRNCKRS